MGFCRRCGEIVKGDRCKCGGASRESTTKILFRESAGDKWSQRYLSRSSSTGLAASLESAVPPPSTSTPTQAPTSSSSSPRVPPPAHTPAPPPARPPPSPSKLAHSFVKQAESEDAELSCVFGSVLSPKDHWQCSACQVKFRQEEVIYPHPEANSDPKLGELYFCRQCFADRFRVGDCKRCRLAVLSDAKFVRHESNLWHETCYVCTYCPNPSNTSIVIDFAARPSCEACFDSFAYKSAGILPSPHLSQSEWAPPPKSVAAPPPPTKWGRPSTGGSMVGGAGQRGEARPNVWSSTTLPRQSDAIGGGARGAEEGQGQGREKGKAWRVRLERENSPLVRSYDELGDKLRQVGLKDSTAPARHARTLSSLDVGDITPVTPSTVPPLKHVAPKAKPLATSSTPSHRPALQPVQPDARIASVTTARPEARPEPLTVPSGSAARPLRPTASSTSVTPLSALARATPTSSDGSSTKTDEEEACPACRRPLGYGQFAQVASGAVLHLDCFVCGSCRKSITSTYVEVEGQRYHKECAPPPKRYRAILTSLADPSPGSPTSLTNATSATTPPSPRSATLTSDLEPDEPTCSACARVLGYGLSVTVPKSGKSYHRECFRCAGCAGTFEHGFVERGGLAYHDKCAPLPPISTSGLSALPRSTIPASPSRTSRPLPPTRDPNPPHPPLPTISSTPSISTSRTLFSTRARPPSHLGGLQICSGCSVRATEKETVPGPGRSRYHRKCLVCGMCGRAVDSECRGGEKGILRCEACRKIEARASRTRAASSAAVPPR
ncbi:hypothetical protein JCM10212_004312 [Sporobolomyces blumeae]